MLTLNLVLFLFLTIHSDDVVASLGFVFTDIHVGIIAFCATIFARVGTIHSWAGFSRISRNTRDIVKRQICNVEKNTVK